MTYKQMLKNFYFWSSESKRDTLYIIYSVNTSSFNILTHANALFHHSKLFSLYFFEFSPRATQPSVYPQPRLKSAYQRFIIVSDVILLNLLLTPEQHFAHVETL